MLEQANNTSDKAPLFQAMPGNEAQSAAQKMLQCVELHNKSTSRDANDKVIDDGAVTSDKTSVSNVSETKALNLQMLELVAAGKAVPGDLKKKAVDLHMQSRGLNNDDKSGDIDAKAKDIRDMKSEQAVINSDRQLLQDNRVSDSLKELLSQDIAAKMQLQQNEKQDVTSEGRYAAADERDNKLNKVVIDALTSKSPLSGHLLGQLLAADNGSKDNIAGLRNRDIHLEPQYSSADLKDQALNAQLNAALKEDPYLSGARRETANLPSWTSEANLQKAEHVQHEKRRLHLGANSTPEQLRMAEIADMNAQLHLSSWSTADQRILARKTK
jgi:hypothetical protein